MDTAVTDSRLRSWHVYGMLPVLLLAAGYYCSAKFAFALTSEALPVPMLWPANAVLITGLLLVGGQGEWLVLAGAFLGHLVASWQSGVPVAMALGGFAGNCGEAVLAALLVRRLLGEQLRFDSLRQVAVFLFCCVFIAPLVASSLELALAGLRDGGSGEALRLWPLRFLSHAAGTLIVTPVLLTWNPGLPASLRRQSGWRRLEAGLLALAATGSIVLLLGAGPTGLAGLSLYTPLPVLLWAALRFAPFVFYLAYLLFAGSAAAATSDGATLGNALSLQVFLIGQAVPLLLLVTARRERGGGLAASERHRAEEELRKQREQLIHLTRVAILGKLSGALAHELNQPLAAILSNAQAARRLMDRHPVNLQEIAAILADIVAEDQRASEVIRCLRALFMKGEPQRQALKINDLVAAALKLARGNLKERKVAVSLELGADPGLVQGDWVQLQQVLLNLIVNAGESMNDGPPEKRRLKLATATDADGRVRVAVTDTGPGIAPEAMDKVFDAFFTTKAYGMGFGLSVSQTIVAAHGGRIEAANDPGGGATFRVILPAHLGVSS